MIQILLSDTPKNGTNFIKIHNFAGAIWAITYRYNEQGNLESYCEAKDEFIESSTVLDFKQDPHHTYYIIS